MIRKQIYIEEREDQFLKRQGEKLGISAAEIIRRMIEYYQQEVVQGREYIVMKDGRYIIQ